jgi:carotenoid cleavage dioxygenase-like enzyme
MTEITKTTEEALAERLTAATDWQWRYENTGGGCMVTLTEDAPDADQIMVTPAADAGYDGGDWLVGRYADEDDEGTYVVVTDADLVAVLRDPATRADWWR